jgi:GT2 family glycosyltransferase
MSTFAESLSRRGRDLTRRWRRLPPKPRRRRAEKRRAEAGLVSAIIATRNRPDHLERVLRSLKKQTYKRIQIVVVDDGSFTDIRNIARKYSVDKFLRTTHLGKARACNAGFLRSTGEFVIFCDDDFELEPSMMEKLVSALLRNPSKAYAYCAFVLEKEDTQLVVGMLEFDPQRLIDANYIGMATLMRRSKFIEGSMFDASLRRLIDWDLWLSLLEKGQEGVLVPEVLYRHLRPEGPRISDDKNPESLPYERARELVAQKHLALLSLARRVNPSMIEKDNETVRAIDALFRLYKGRSDLQSAFPEAMEGEYSRLLQWAREWLATGRDGSSVALVDHAEWYRQNEWVKLVDRLDQAKMSLAQRESMIESMTAERSQLTEQLDQAKKELSQNRSTVESMTAERSQLTEQLDQAKKELDEIHHSLGYKLMRFYASPIDRLFPSGTSRGEFRKVVTASLHIITEQGIASFSRQASKKIRRKEFRITEPMRRETGRESGLGMRLGLSDEELVRGLREFLSSAHGVLEFTYYRDPIVSVVIVTYNKAHYTLQCLRDLHINTSTPCEVIIVDNASSDETPVLLPRLRNITTLLNTENLFFSRACNQGARTARGKYLLFLNNDVFMNEDCVSWLTKTLESASDVGGAGAKLVWRDGRIQEAGSVIWPDGSAHGYGRGDDPSKPQYCYARDVDFCSAACLIVRRDAFEKLGGFDEAFTPAYYEDADLCIRLWNAGYRVVYQPLAIATHIEFGSSSSETAKNLMEKHRAVFLEKHRNTLKNRPIPPHCH